MVQTVREFINDAYQIISSSSPTVPLHGDDQLKGLQILNELLSSFSASGLLLTIAKTVSTTLSIGQNNVTFADASYTPAADVQEGRLANLENAYLALEGVTYPLIDESRNVFFNSYKYAPQVGLPLFVILTFGNDVTNMQVYPGASQEYELFVYGKFELTTLTLNDTMSLLPSYYTRFLRLAVSKDLSIYKGRSSAWTPLLEDMLVQARKDMQAVSSVNLAIQSNHDSLLNGSWRVRAGV